jgi:hypothetical protein
MLPYKYRKTADVKYNIRTLYIQMCLFTCYAGMS